MPQQSDNHSYDSKCVRGTPPQDEPSGHPAKKVFQESIFAHPDEVAERKRKREVIAGHGEFLRRYRWHLFLSMDGPANEDLTPEVARRMAERWVELAKPDYAYAVYERGGKNHHGHLHVLAGGKYNGGTWHDVDTAEGKLGIWRYAGNDFACTGHNWGFGTKEIVVRHFELYNPRLGVAEYISKGLVENPEYAQMWHPRRPHRRKRGRRNR